MIDQLASYVRHQFLCLIVRYVDEEFMPRFLLLWHSREDQRICRFLGENIESRYTIARDAARYL